MPSVNKIVLGDKTLIDLTEDTVTTSSILSGITAHAANGEVITGTYSPTNVTLKTKTVTSNGVYNASDDVADGYSTFTVNMTLSPSTAIDGTPVMNDLDLVTVIIKNDDVIPNDAYGAFAVVYNNEIHLLYGRMNGTRTHYKWDGSSWILVSTPPNIDIKSVVVLNDGIHIMDTSYSQQLPHYKWNGSTWSLVSNVGASGCNSAAFADVFVNLNNEIYTFVYSFDDYKYYYYKWTGSSWSRISLLPISTTTMGAVTHNGEIHIIGGANNQTAHYKWNGSAWVSVSTLPVNFVTGAVVSYDNAIYIVYDTYVYRYYNLTWTHVSELISFINSASNASAVNYNDEIHLFYTTDTRFIHYKLVNADTPDATPWTRLSEPSRGVETGYSALVYDDKINILGGDNLLKRGHYIYNDQSNSWNLFAYNLPYAFYNGTAIKYNNLLYLLGGDYTGKQKAFYKWDRSRWKANTEDNELPLDYSLSNNDCSAIVYNDEIHLFYNNSNTRKKHYKGTGSSWTAIANPNGDIMPANPGPALVVTNGYLISFRTYSYYGYTYLTMQYLTSRNMWYPVGDIIQERHDLKLPNGIVSLQSAVVHDDHVYIMVKLSNDTNATSKVYRYSEELNNTEITSWTRNGYWVLVAESTANTTCHCLISHKSDLYIVCYPKTSSYGCFYKLPKSAYEASVKITQELLQYRSLV